jgi:hypothetical protein
LERSGKRSSGIQSQQYQELSAAAAATTLITLKSSETQSVDLTDKVRVNHYLRHFERRSALHGLNRTGSFRYMSDETSKGAQLQGYMLECVRRTETQRIRTATNFLRRSSVLMTMFLDHIIESNKHPVPGSSVYRDFCEFSLPIHGVIRLVG